ncbi:MAG TPA: TPM domain-containing protein [Saprospiraceae bacterium]|nr:TPM domain-containing protein [Saprospiraceae bacterium]HMQ81943.1 TPM domain-containing protein [Saprospiraceae bacterium]
MIKFFQREEEERMIFAIREAELKTSGEIRVHLEDNCKGEILQEARRVFKKLGMHRTKARNGVLIFLAPDRKAFAIIGDQGIHELVGDAFWQEERDLMQSFFQQGDFTEGICQAIEKVGEKLKQYFPYEEDDKNELSDEISYN